MKKDTKRCTNFVHGFTLAELLMAVLVISIIMVALAPVITRRAYDNISIEVNKKKGLEIFTNPGIYSFDVPVGINTLFIQGAAGGGGGAGATYIDKSVTFTSSTTWTIPKGVSQLTFTITGAGGGGGGGYAKTSSENCVSKTNRIDYLADNGKDVCISEPQKIPNRACSGGVTTVKSGESCLGNSCCWSDVNVTCTASPAGGTSGCGRTVCMYNPAACWCGTRKDRSGFANNYGAPREGRLLTNSEAVRILQRDKLGAGGLDICYDPVAGNAECAAVWNKPYNVTLTRMARCDMGTQGSAMGSANNYAYPTEAWLAGLYEVLARCSGPLTRTTGTTGTNAISVFCAYELENWNQFSGAGGNSGAKFEQTINVLPNDTLTITIGAGGAGGNAGSRGSQGAATQIIHKRGSTTMGTFYVKGGLGGYGATVSANGASIGNGTASNQTTPSGTCYSQYKNSSGTTVGGNVNCSTISYSGTSGTELKGGSGARVADSGSAAQGGGIDTGEGSAGIGYKATTYGFGGGGSTCKRGVRTAASCSKGGSGAAGKIDITYRVMLPGSGGGSGTRVGGVSTDNKMYELKYKVEEGSRLVLEVGAGGSGGNVGQDGINGSPTIIGNNDIVFLAGQGGFAVSAAQKSNLNTCIGSNTNSTTIANCINNTSYKPVAGKASNINQDNNIVTNALGLIIKNQSKVSYTISSSSFKGNDGRTSSQVSASIVPWIYGFDGGNGGAPFKIGSTNIAAAVTCSGGISASYGTTTDANSYVCTSGSPDGNNARTHDPVNNEFGGSGGSGGGVVADSLTLGKGGNGSSGYLRIRWDESEQE